MGDASMGTAGVPLGRRRPWGGAARLHPVRRVSAQIYGAVAGLRLRWSVRTTTPVRLPLLRHHASRVPGAPR